MLDRGHTGHQFGNGKRPGLHDGENFEIGPGHYNNGSKGTLDRRHGKIPKAKRGHNLISGSGAIGPGDYNTYYDPKRGGKPGWTIAQRYRGHEGDDGPGPGNYNDVPESKFKKSLNQGVKFGRSKRQGIDSGDSKIGPGAYNNAKDGLRGGFSFGRDPRKGDDRENIPGPGAYDTSKFQGKRSKTVGSFGKRKRNIGGTLDKDGAVGPGYYDPKKNFWNKGHTMGKDRKLRLQENSGPDPTSYNLKSSSFKRTGYSFPRAPGAKQNVTTPGFHKIPCSVPDVANYLLPAPQKRKIHL